MQDQRNDHNWQLEGVGVQNMEVETVDVHEYVH